MIGNTGSMKQYHGCNYFLLGQDSYIKINYATVELMDHLSGSQKNWSVYDHKIKISEGDQGEKRQKGRASERQDPWISDNFEAN